MNYLKNTRLAMLSLAVGGLIAATALVQAQQGAPDAALREIGIMRNIFAAALNDNAQNNRNRFRMGPPESLYLAGQGMVFTFHLNGSGFGGINLKLSEMPPMPPVVYTDGNGDFDFDFDFDFDYDFDYGDGNEYNRALAEQQQEYTQRLNDMSQQLRDKQEELRDDQREIRELQRQMRRDPDADHEARIEELNASIETIMQEFQGQATTMQQLQQEYEAERLAAFEAVRTEQTALIFSTLCDYGNTLRSLANGEHISIVLHNYADGQTQINVFDYADIASCTSADTLRQSATTYIQDSRGF
jgi:hypothetical protein